MPRAHLWFLPPLTLLATACGASAPPAQSVPEYPPLPVAVLGTLELQPAPAAVVIDAPCIETEYPNGFDDDCDGRVDQEVGGPEPAALIMALSWTGGAALRLSTEPAVVAAQTGQCDGPEACVLYVALDELAVSEGDILIQVGFAGDRAPEAPVTASLSVTTDGRSLGTHNLTLEPTAPGAAQPIARLVGQPAP